MNLILFGPPGVGKSTLIGILKSIGHRAIDLEDIYPSKVRFQMPNMVDGVIFGAADLNPGRTYQNAVKILLSMKQDAYESRRKERDSRIPGKSNQKTHLISDWLKGVKYDVILDVSGSPRDTAKSIGRIYHDFNKKGSK